MNAADFRSGNGTNLTDSESRGTTYFFTVPAESASRNCSGDVVSIQYCYQARDSDRNRVRTVFNLLAVNRNGLQFTIISSTPIQTTPQDSICTDPGGFIQQICCDTTPLSGLHVPPSEYTFGIVITNRDVRPLAFADSVREYRVEQYSDRLGNNGPSPGSTVTLLDGDRNTDHTLLLMRFTIGILISSAWIIFCWCMDLVSVVYRRPNKSIFRLAVQRKLSILYSIKLIGQA